MDIIAQLATRSGADLMVIIQAASEMPDTYSVGEKLQAGIDHFPA